MFDHFLRWLLPQQPLLVGRESRLPALRPARTAAVPCVKTLRARFGSQGRSCWAFEELLTSPRPAWGTASSASRSRCSHASDRPATNLHPEPQEHSTHFWSVYICMDHACAACSRPCLRRSAGLAVQHAQYERVQHCTSRRKPVVSPWVQPEIWRHVSVQLCQPPNLRCRCTCE